MVPVADKVARWSAAIISLSPVIGIITRHPIPFSLVLLLGLSGFIARMMVHAVTPVLRDTDVHGRWLLTLKDFKAKPQDHKGIVSVR